MLAAKIEGRCWCVANVLARKLQPYSFLARFFPDGTTAGRLARGVRADLFLTQLFQAEQQEWPISGPAFSDGTTRAWPISGPVFFRKKLGQNGSGSYVSSENFRHTEATALQLDSEHFHRYGAYSLEGLTPPCAL